MECTGAQILLESMKREGVDVLFGYPGGAVIDIYDELPRHPELRHVLVRHEQGAVHAADGYARASGKTGVCLVTSGPGATNTVTGIATAYSDSIPLVVFTGQVPTQLIGNDAFQEVDIVGITRPCTKHNFLVKDITKLALTIRQAFYLARSGRPGPVLVDLPKDVMQKRAEFVWPEDVYMRSYNPTYKPNLNQLRRSVEELAKAERPVILAGGGVILSDGAEALTGLARKLNIPVTCTLMGLGAFPATDPLWLGMVGMHGTYAANLAINNCDVLMCVGARFDDRVTGRLAAFAPKARIVHIDIDPTSIRKNVEVHVPVVGDCRLALEGIAEICEAKLENKDWAGEHAAWIAAVAEWKASKPLCYQCNGNIKPQSVIEALYDITGGDAIIATEVGQHQMWVAQFYSFTKPRTLLTSGGLGTMGYGFPASVGAQFAFPDKKVIAVAGDASLQMNIQELATVVANRLPIKVVILNNRYLGMVRQWQELFYNNNYSSTNMEAQPDFVKLAEAYGAEGYRIEKAEDMRAVLEKALASPNPAFIDVVVEREENVYPIVPAGAALDEMLLV
ncbi:MULTISPECIES: biosynthetic-type acetolactate synthase large subunit [Desulfovibrio]|uniref:Acetolactate synthase n=2 Tax=root TaxID=1 RepID=A0A212KB06_9BACT|nr:MULTISPECIES: biosynthetic-type acetolactate synthase large subunit [Desulfovibrio]MBD8897305.1 biosynthetic-type acetolactate synthase large subunit [Desulfovibrio desulfuricans]MBT9749691.1 biosynthetic-type acetolactate synthase large subunit [Desulfovibrio desulfuricans]MCB6543177.1 biosynthetic-type acetolactate synthase large subunit [Desulfovibrio desulfuricans]MCB6554234.1 biosynthetic-type acetolactate synthase large subunit [Desulfovibrio desulfuricans]MCB6564901.1 biosynthetic-ty